MRLLFFLLLSYSLSLFAPFDSFNIELERNAFRIFYIGSVSMDDASDSNQIADITFGYWLKAQHEKKAEARFINAYIELHTSVDADLQRKELKKRACTLFQAYGAFRKRADRQKLEKEKYLELAREHLELAQELSNSSQTPLHRSVGSKEELGT